MSQATQKHRNTNSLTLNNPVKPGAKSTKGDRSSIDEAEINQKTKDVPIKDKTKVDVKETSKVNNDEKQSSKKDKIPVVGEDAKSEKNATKNEEKLKNGSNDTVADANPKISNGSHKREEVVVNDENKSRETRQKATTVKDNKSENLEKVKDANSDKNEKSAVANKEKEKDSIKTNQKDKKSEKEEKQASPKETPQKDSKEIKSTSQLESPKDKANKESIKSPSKTKKLEEKAEEAFSPSKTGKSRGKEQTIWDSEEMEPLMMQVDVDEKTPKKQQSPLTSTPTPSSRILRLRSGAPSTTSSPLSMLTLDPKNNTSTYVNVSTPLTNPHSPDKSYGAKLRTVSARRPMLREIVHHSSYREHGGYNDSYNSRSINESTSSGYLDHSQRSVNTSSFVARKRYMEEQNVEEIENTKRPRLDVSGLLSLVASPVTMLRNRLSRARIQCSTPKSNTINKDDIEIDTVTAASIHEPNEVATKMDEEVIAEEENKAASKDDIVENEMADLSTAPENTEIETDDIQIKILKEINKVESSPFVPNDAIKKKWNCNLM